VRWFGDHTFTQVEPVKLKTLTEGLDAQHRETKKHRKWVVSCSILLLWQVLVTFQWCQQFWWLSHLF